LVNGLCKWRIEVGFPPAKCPQRIWDLLTLLWKGDRQLFPRKWLSHKTSRLFPTIWQRRILIFLNQLPSSSRTILRNNCRTQGTLICSRLHVFWQRMCSCLTNIYSAKRALNLVWTMQRPFLTYLFMSLYTWNIDEVCNLEISWSRTVEM
jgi:hypothetical protein